MSTETSRVCWACGAPLPEGSPACGVCKARVAETMAATPRKPRVSCCLLGFVVASLAIVASVVAYRLGETRRRAERCGLVLRQIGSYFRLYRDRFGAEPATFRDICRPDMATDKWIFICLDRPPDVHFHDEDSGLFGPYETYEAYVGFEYRRPEAQPADPAKTAVAWDKAPHGDGLRTVLFYDGSVRRLTEAEFAGVPNGR